MDRRLKIIYSIVLIDIAIGTVIWPILPELVKGGKNPAFLLSIGTAIFLGIQLFTAPLLGKLSDKYGRKPVFLASSIGTFFANFFLLFKNTSGYFLNRGTDGLTNGVYSTIRASITDISSKEDLTKNIGLESTMVSIGFVVGPMLAGLLIIILGIEGQESVVPLIVLGLSLSFVNILLCALFKETNTHLNSNKISIGSSLNPLSNLKEFKTLKKENIILYRLLILNAFLVLTLGYYHYYVTFISLGELKMSPKEISFFFTYMGFVSIVTSYLFYTKVVHKINQTRFISTMAIIGVLVLLSYTFIGTSKWAIYFIVVVDCLTINLIAGVLESQIGDKTTKQNRGKIFGLNQMISSFASITTAVVFGLLTLLSIEMPFYWFAICLIPLIFTERLINGRKTSASNVYNK